MSMVVPLGGKLEDPFLRDRMSTVRGLFVLSMVMVECGDERQILQMAAKTVPSLARCRAVGLYVDRVWRPVDSEWNAAEDVALLVAQLEELASAGGPVDLRDRAWGWAYSLRSPGGASGFMVVGAEEEPSPTEQFLLRSLAQQTAVTLANARLHARERATAQELRAAKAQLEASVRALERGSEIHQGLMQAALAGGGQEGIALALHELTGYPVAIEDGYGNLRGWAGPHRPDPYPKDPPARREQLLRRALRNPRPFRDGGRLVTLARLRDDVVGVLALIDPVGRAGEQERVALEQGATVLAMELARIQSLAEAELRLRRDLVEELLAGTDEESALGRAQALGYDLERSHRVVVVEGRARSADENLFFHAVRRAARDLGVGSLLVARAGVVVVLSDAEQPFGERFRSAILAELGGGRCRIGVGGKCERPGDFPRSLREAELALRLQRMSNARDCATAFDELGVCSVLCDVQDIGTIDRFVGKWLGPLLDYDARRGSELVATLSDYLECGGNYDATAAALCIHRSTLKYRLQRIRDLCGFDLRDPDVQFTLQFASRAWRTLLAFRQTSTS